METTTTIAKSARDGWGATTHSELGNDRVLEISTCKASGGALVTTAYVHIREGNFLSHRFGLAGGGDFSQRLQVSKVRVTENAVRAQHMANLANLATISQCAREHYARDGVAA